MSEVLLDSDIVSLFFKGHPEVVENMGLYLKKYGSFRISALTYYEVRRGLEAMGIAGRVQGFERWVGMNRVIPFDTPVAKLAATLHAALKSNGRPTGEVDLLIAATALHHRWELVTNNERHFRNIPGLRVRNWTRPPA